jgi:hypothetical protein
MSRFSISKVMAVIALAAANCAAFRELFPFVNGGNITGILFMGLLPLANAQIVGLYLLFSRYRICYRRRTREERTGIAPTFVAVNTLVLLASVTACLVFTSELIDFLEFSLHPLQAFFLSLGRKQTDFEAQIFEAMIPIYLCVVLSGPPLLVVLIVCWLRSRYKFVITPRYDPASGPNRANGDSGEPPSNSNTV